MPSATLEAPDTFTRLPAPLWPRLPWALATAAERAHVAFYLALDKVTSNNGASSGTGVISLFLTFKRHLVVAPHLAGAHLGSADTEASDWAANSFFLRNARSLEDRADDEHPLEFRRDRCVEIERNGVSHPSKKLREPLSDRSSELPRKLIDHLSSFGFFAPELAGASM